MQMHSFFTQCGLKHNSAKKELHYNTSTANELKLRCQVYLQWFRLGGVDKHSNIHIILHGMWSSTNMCNQ